ncbi:hypothetical protein [Geodermatophilus sp. URMC 64]
MLLLGLLTPLVGAVVVEVMAVARGTNHRSDGFFIFRPGESCECVMTSTAAGLFPCTAGAGSLSLEHALSLDVFGWPAPLGCVAVGVGRTGALLIRS